MGRLRVTASTRLLLPAGGILSHWLRSPRQPLAAGHQLAAAGGRHGGHRPTVGGPPANRPPSLGTQGYPQVTPRGGNFWALNGLFMVDSWPLLLYITAPDADPGHLGLGPVPVEHTLPLRQRSLQRRCVGVLCCAFSFGCRLFWWRGPYLHGELGRGPYLHGEVHSGGLARCRPRFVSLCKRLPPCLRGVHAVARFLAAAWTRAEGRVTRGTFGCLLVRGLRSFPSWDRAECRVSRGTLGCRLGPVLSPSRRVEVEEEGTRAVAGIGHPHLRAFLVLAPDLG